jgi:hypothetical protein
MRADQVGADCTRRSALVSRQLASSPLAFVFHMGPDAMPTYLVTLRVTRPPNFTDGELVELFGQAIEKAMCVPIEVTDRGMVIEAEESSLQFLETALRVKLGAHGGTLETMTAVRI